MLKRLIVLALSLMIMLTTLVVAIPAYADFKDGDIVTISESAGGGVYYNYNADQKYYVSAMNATMEGSDATYFAWCASYGVSVPQAGRRYRLCNTDNAGTVTVDGGEWPLFYAVPSEGIYWYYDTGLGDYIDFSWALSCIKAAEHLASTTELPFTELPFSWRMAVELAIRSQLQGMFGNYGLDLNVEVADNNLFGYAISSYFTEPDCDTVAEFMDRAKDIADYANTHPIFWEPYAEEIEAVEERRNFYRGDDFILFEGHLNKSNCELVGKDTYPGVEVEFDGGMLTVSIPKSKIPIGQLIEWNVDLQLDAGDNYNMFYGKPENGGTDVQNIVVYSVNKKDLEKSFEGSYITTEEKATVTVQKTDENGKALSGMKFDLYSVGSNNALTFMETLVTNENGIAHWKDLYLGDYFLVENCEGTGYEPHKPEEWQIDGATSAVYTTISGKSGWKISLAPGDVGATVSAVNKETLKDLNILKTDTEGNSMPGFKFTVYPVNADGTLGAKKQGTTNASGLISFSKLPIGTYFLVENYEGTGYVPHKPEEWIVTADKAEYTTIGGKQGWKITLSKNNASIEAVNKKIVKDLFILKTDTEGNCMPGFKFTLYPILPNGSLGTGTTKETRSDGYVLFAALELGDYFVVENYEDTGYEPHKPEEWIVTADKAEYTTIGGKQGWKITLSKNNATIEAVNKRSETSLLVEKFTTDDSDPQGFKFTLYPVNADGTLGAKKQGTTNASGLISFSKLPIGTYFLVENYEGTGYAPHKPEQWQIGGVLSKEYTTINGMQGWKLQLGKAKAWVYADNYKIPTLSLNKTDRDGKPIKGMEFSIYTLSGDIPLYIDSFKTDENGYINFEIKETGSYFIIEEQNGKWEAFKPNEWRVVGASSAEYTTVGGNNGWLLYLDEGDDASIEAVNDYTVSLTLKKQSTAGKTLEGATFALEVSFDNGESFSFVESKTTPESGVITFENLDRYAVYRVTETKAPTGYALLGDAVFVGRIAQEDITLTVGDSLILTMPTTGGNGMWLATLASALFAISAGWLISAGRKRKLSHR